MQNVSKTTSASLFTNAVELASLIQCHIDAVARVDTASDGEAAVQAAFENEQAALDALLQYPTRDLAEVRTKTAYFLEHLHFLGCEDPRMVMFLRAMM
ncbi:MULTISPECIES: hypothetical protein [unclassified Phyllobacterium]|uniref:hypothetical protein n=1 Tax=unclassified Phyllobacterium TaxID=2638441 RepID=UPI003012A9DE